MNYYNEFDPNAAAWLKQLIQLNLIPQGDVDTRSITEVKPHELTGYTQCHFFAGIGGWSYALQLANWDATRPVWTGSCPCQPFSSAGKGLGAADERHLWPAFFNLIKECRPQYVFGEQVASAIGHGWLDGISADLGEEGYACGSAVLGAHSVGAPHIRQRLYWMAYSSREGCDWSERSRETGAQGPSIGYSSECSRGGCWVGDTESIRSGEGQQDSRGSVTGGNEEQGTVSIGGCSIGGVEYPECSGFLGSSNSNRESSETRRQTESDNNREPSEGCADASWVAYTPSKQAVTADTGGLHAEFGSSCRLGDSNGERHDGQHTLLQRDESRRNEEDLLEASWPCEAGWSRYDLIPCRDGKQRRVESGTFPLVNGLPKGMVYSSDPSAPINPQETAEARVMRLKGYGNAIVPQVAAAFIQAAIESSRN